MPSTSTSGPAHLGTAVSLTKPVFRSQQPRPPPRPAGRPRQRLRPIGAGPPPGRPPVRRLLVGQHRDGPLEPDREIPGIQLGPGPQRLTERDVRPPGPERLALARQHPPGPLQVDGDQWTTGPYAQPRRSPRVWLTPPVRRPAPLGKDQQTPPILQQRCRQVSRLAIDLPALDRDGVDQEGEQGRLPRSVEEIVGPRSHDRSMPPALGQYRQQQ